VTLNPDFKVMILSSNNYKMVQVCLQWQTDSKPYRTAPFSTTLNDLYPNFKVTPLFDAEYLRNDTRYIVSVDY